MNPERMLRIVSYAASAVAALALPVLGGRALAADDQSAAAQMLDTLGPGAAAAPVTADAVAHARQAIDQAARLRGSGDEAHAKAADGLALEWAETARDLAKSTEAEEKAAELRRKAMDAQAKLERTRALVAEGIARAGRLRAELEEASHAVSKEHAAVEVHDGEAAPTKKSEPKDKPAKSATHGDRK
jgi:hypothetical protein